MWENICDDDFPTVFMIVTIISNLPLMMLLASCFYIVVLNDHFLPDFLLAAWLLQYPLSFASTSYHHCILRDMHLSFHFQGQFEFISLLSWAHRLGKEMSISKKLRLKGEKKKEERDIYMRVFVCC